MSWHRIYEASGTALDIPSTLILMIEDTVWHDDPKFPNGVQRGSDLIIMKAITSDFFITSYLLNDSVNPVDMDAVTKEKTAPIMEIFNSHYESGQSKELCINFQYKFSGIFAQDHKFHNSQFDRLK